MADTDRRSTDWEAIEREYRAGQLSVREIARQHALSEGAVRKRAKAEGWQRALAEKVREAVREGLVRGGTQAQRASDAEIVQHGADRGIRVVREHQHLLGRGRDLTLRLLDELDVSTTNVGELQEMIEAATALDKTAQRRNAMMKAIELPSRAGVIKDLSAAAKNWVSLERQAFNLDDGSSDLDKPVVIVKITTDDPTEAARQYQRLMSGE